MEKKICQALMLMPETRRSYYRGIKMRCTFSAKPESNFCGVHAKLGEYIEEIVWKTDCVHSIRRTDVNGETYCKNCGSYEDVK